MISISQAEFDRMRKHLEAGYPHEACGVLVGEIHGDHKHVAYAAPVKNAWAGEPGDAHDLRDRYSIAPEDIVRIDREAGKKGLDIIGFFHSHPDWPSTPSETDREWAWPIVSFVIASVRGGKMQSVQSWVLNDDRAAFVEEHIVIVDSESYSE